MKPLSFLSLIFVALLATGMGNAPVAEGKKIDLNGDGYVDGRTIFSGKNAIETLVDFNHDGIVETKIVYKKGYRDTAEMDTNADGKVDTWIEYYFTGIPWKLAQDRDFNGRPDYWAYFKNGRLYRWEADQNQDGKADIKTVYRLEEGSVPLSMPPGPLSRIASKYSQSRGGAYHGQNIDRL